MRRDKLGLERIIFFSDAVFAIAITLLALDLKLPTTAATGSLSHSLFKLWPAYQSYVTSFLVIGLYWVGHHHYFRFIRSYDYIFISLNIALLGCIAALPFATSVLDRYPTHPGAVAFYAFFMAMTGYLNTMLWCYAAAGGRLINRLSWKRQRLLLQRALAPPVVFTVSIGLAVFNPALAKLSWIAVVFICLPYPLHKSTLCSMLGKSPLNNSAK